MTNFGFLSVNHLGIPQSFNLSTIYLRKYTYMKRSNTHRPMFTLNVQISIDICRSFYLKRSSIHLFTNVVIPKYPSTSLGMFT